MASSPAVVPGQVLGRTTSHVPGEGTHVLEDQIVASIVGRPVVTPATKGASTTKPTVSVPRRPAGRGTRPAASLPVVGSVVLCRVTRVQQRQLAASILQVVVADPSGPSSGPDPVVACYSQVTDDEMQFQAVLRREDVRTHEKDKVVLNDMYRVGDIVRAAVISLGDERNYYLSTAGNDYGVVVATSEAGNAMVPASWKEMKDVATGHGESRKVAKPA